MRNAVHLRPHHQLCTLCSLLSSKLTRIGLIWALHYGYRIVSAFYVSRLGQEAYLMAEPERIWPVDGHIGGGEQSKAWRDQEQSLDSSDHRRPFRVRVLGLSRLAETLRRSRWVERVLLAIFDCQQRDRP